MYFASKLAACCIACALVTFVNQTSSAQAPKVINIDFGSGTLYSGTAAGPGTGTVWNGIGGGATVNTPLVDSMGAATTAMLTKSNDQAHNGGGGGSPTSNNLMIDYLHNGNTDATVGTVTFGGLTPLGLYELYLYGHGDQPDQYAEFTVAAANGGAVGNVTGATREPFGTPANYVVLMAQANASGMLSYTWGEDLDDANNSYAAHNGVQLVELAVPEPTSVALWSLLAVVGMCYCLRRRA